MSRICKKCGVSVGIGQGKWVGDKKRPETLRLYHQDPSICDLAKVRIDAKRESALRHGLGHRHLPVPGAQPVSEGSGIHI